MKIEVSSVRKMDITEVPHLDRISVYMEDFGPQRGSILIKCYGDSWTAGWGAMGNEYDIRRFVLSCDNDYLIRKLDCGIKRTVTDFDALPDHARKTVIDWRKEAGGIDADRARKLYEMADWLDCCDCQERLGQFEDELNAIYGDEWYEHLPQKPNPKYNHLSAILDAVKTALKF